MLNDNLIVYSNEYTRLNTQSLELKRKNSEQIWDVLKQLPSSISGMS